MEWFHGVMVSTQDSESCDLSSNFGGWWFSFIDCLGWDSTLLVTGSSHVPTNPQAPTLYMRELYEPFQKSTVVSVNEQKAFSPQPG